MAYNVGFNLSGCSLARAVGNKGITLLIRQDASKFATIQIGKGGLWLRLKDDKTWTKYTWKKLIHKLTE